MNDTKLKPCWLRDGCPGKTASCFSEGPTDNGCPVYRWFRNLFKKEDVIRAVMDAPTVAEDTNVLSKWISVKERLPEENRFVLVCNDDGHMMVAQYVGEEPIWIWQYKYTNYDVDVWDDQEQGPVCWWMPLPEPPKEG